MAKGRRYTVPDPEAAHELGRIAQDAIAAARDRAPNQRLLAHRLFQAIYGPLRDRPLTEDLNTIKSTPRGAA